MWARWASRVSPRPRWLRWPGRSLLPLAMALLLGGGAPARSAANDEPATTRTHRTEKRAKRISIDERGRHGRHAQIEGDLDSEDRRDDDDDSSGSGIHFESDDA